MRRSAVWLPIVTMLAMTATAASGTPAITAEQATPSKLDPGVRQFDDLDVILSRGAADKDAPLAIFLPGTGGRPQNVLPLLNVIAGQGYRVIGLSYDDEPSVSQVCPRDPDSDCSAKFREVRTYGDGKGPVANPPAEAIVPRLVALLRALDAAHPGAGWGGYLGPDGQPLWSRILVSGLSQGAGMAAFIAKRSAVYRVVLFSSPWDTTDGDRRPAPWLSAPSATPPERWWAERHRREKTTDLIAAAYRALAIPPAQILLFDGALPPGRQPGGPNPYHGSTVHLLEYADRWRQMYGKVGG